MNIPFRSALIASLLALSSICASAQTATPFAATLQTAANGDLVLHWPGETDQHYRVEASADLQNWTALPTVYTGGGSEMETIVRAAGTSDPARQFWRVVTIDPSALIATGADGKVSLTWGAVAGATTYNIKRGPHGGPYRGSALRWYRISTTPLSPTARHTTTSSPP
ncbi:MAG: hypothetical protein IPL39_19565 [Opitutaceae bacterium]|nr:hypothetical protein [Opitutaceae bacterium]